ncbi:uncharacterized protein [Nothobranchius furzeri]|uniref:LOC107379082-like protein n=1 Tax=Nothobranchius furzeri TaxID=105023 RepID=A0A9D2YVA2_NOTFU|nr:uncharacterized protein LOC107379082 [Nothobranchius furzeri]KAF7226518.1 putative LOC107379082-like protein [Nothobranchius furzeri]
MASTPSASSLSAVLRCREEIWTRNLPAKRPAAAYSLGLSGGVRGDAPAKPSGPNRGFEWRIFSRGERPVAGRGLYVACRWKTRGEEICRETDNMHNRKLSQPAPPPVLNWPGCVIKSETRTGVLHLSVTIPVLPEPSPLAMILKLLVSRRSRSGNLQLHQSHPNRTQQVQPRNTSGPEGTQDRPD